MNERRKSPRQSKVRSEKSRRTNHVRIDLTHLVSDIHLMNEPDRLRKPSRESDGRSKKSKPRKHLITGLKALASDLLDVLYSENVKENIKENMCISTVHEIQKTITDLNLRDFQANANSLAEYHICLLALTERFSDKAKFFQEARQGLINTLVKVKVLGKNENLTKLIRDFLIRDGVENKELELPKKNRYAYWYLRCVLNDSLYDNTVKRSVIVEWLVLYAPNVVDPENYPKLIKTAFTHLKLDVLKKLIIFLKTQSALARYQSSYPASLWGSCFEQAMMTACKVGYLDAVTLLLQHNIELPKNPDDISKVFEVAIVIRDEKLLERISKNYVLEDFPKIFACDSYEGMLKNALVIPSENRAQIKIKLGKGLSGVFPSKQGKAKAKNGFTSNMFPLPPLKPQSNSLPELLVSSVVPNVPTI